MCLARRLSIIIGISTILLSIIIILIGQGAHAQYNPSYCQGKKDEMLTRFRDWALEWSTARTDPN